jgi:His/Glu/Gln/Arg/opine family amino acid ABC transporter permease subunit
VFQFDASILILYRDLIVSGFANTVLFSGASILLGVVGAVILAFGRLSRRKLARAFAGSIVQAVRNTPFLVQVFTLYYALPGLGVSLSVNLAGLTALSIFAAANFAESLRGAILSVPTGQLESARSVGMPYGLGMRRIVIPQSIGYLIPALTNNMIGVVKESSVLSVITLPELTMATQIILGITFSPATAYTIAGVLYWIFTAMIAMGMAGAQKLIGTQSKAPIWMESDR